MLSNTKKVYDKCLWSIGGSPWSFGISAIS